MIHKGARGEQGSIGISVLSQGKSPGKGGASDKNEHFSLDSGFDGFEIIEQSSLNSTKLRNNIGEMFKKESKEEGTDDEEDLLDLMDKAK